MHGKVSIARCAELLTAAGDKIERSALSRYCDSHSLKLGRQGKGVMVDFEVVQQHRKNNYQREFMGGAAVLPMETPAALAATAPASSSPPAAVANLPDRNDPARGLKEIQLRQALREEAMEEGLLAPVAEMDAGGADAIVDMRAAFAEARPDFAERLAAELGLAPEKVRVLRAGLKRYDRIGQERFATRIAAALAAVNEPRSRALDRLNALAAVALWFRSDRRFGAGLEARRA